MCESEGTGLSESRELAVRAELNRLLESPAFRTSKRCREFLEYIVGHTISGPSGTLKERSIGVELFQLPQDFDPGQHTIVRVTANEVRKKLAQHYLAENGSSQLKNTGSLRMPSAASFVPAARLHARSTRIKPQKLISALPRLYGLSGIFLIQGMKGKKRGSPCLTIRTECGDARQDGCARRYVQRRYLLRKRYSKLRSVFWKVEKVKNRYRFIFF